MAEVWVGITGSRGFAAPGVVRDFIRRLKSTTGIVSGKCRNSPDEWAATAARERGLEIKEIPADWDRYGKSAGFRRNKDIVAQANYVVGFWDGKSRGTADTLRQAIVAGKLYAAYGPDGTKYEDLEPLLYPASSRNR